jgi:hypothetical protein
VRWSRASWVYGRVGDVRRWSGWLGGIAVGNCMVEVWGSRGKMVLVVGDDGWLMWCVVCAEE